MLSIKTIHHITQTNVFLTGRMFITVKIKNKKLAGTWNDLDQPTIYISHKLFMNVK